MIIGKTFLMHRTGADCYQHIKAQNKVGTEITILALLNEFTQKRKIQKCFYNSKRKDYENITYTCDIQKCTKEASVINEKIQIIFRTNQSDGTASNPYFETQKLDICKDCLEKIYNGNYIFAYGAQGFNDYCIKE